MGAAAVSIIVVLTLNVRFVPLADIMVIQPVVLRRPELTGSGNQAIRGLCAFSSLAQLGLMPISR